MLPRLLIVDDLFGRNVPSGRNIDRENLCACFLWQDVTSDEAAKASVQKVLKPTAEVVFCRGQSPPCAAIGDTVENDIHVALSAVRSGLAPSGHSNDYLLVERHFWSMILLDLCFYTGPVTRDSHRKKAGMPDGRPQDDEPQSYFGLALLDAIHREFPDLPILILSSKPRDEVSLEFSSRGALGFIDRTDLRAPELLQESLRQHGLLTDQEEQMAGQSLPLLLALREARRAARHQQDVLIRGERGTGKELMARYLHRMSRPAEGRDTRAFAAVNSPVLTPQLFASELYGIEPKTATGVDGKIGLIEMANGGDVFLDEIADMAQEVQASLLRVIQERQIMRVGGRKPKPVDVRFIAATNAEIEDESFGFRADLLDRLSTGGTIWMPPLRDRPADIPLLVEKFVRQVEGRRLGIFRRTVTPRALERLQSYEWPGNVRELQAVITDAVNRHPDVEHLVPDHLRLGTESKAPAGRAKRKAKIGRLQGTTSVAATGLTLPDLLTLMAETIFDSQSVSQWAGKLDVVLREEQKLVSRMIQAALDATKRRTPDHPSGHLQIHPALKLLTGNPRLTATKAADVLKRLLGPIADTLEGDLKEAHQSAIRLRPKSGKAIR